MKSRFLTGMLFCLCVFALNAAPVTGSALSMAVEKNIIRAGFTPSRIPLAKTAQDVFAYNITVDFPATGSAQDTKSRLLFTFTQEEVLQESEAFADFLYELSKISHHEDVTILCTAGDTALQGLTSEHTGTAEYVDIVKEFETPAVVAVTLGTDPVCTIRTGSYRRTSPRYLTEAVLTALYAEKASYHHATTVASFYRLGFIQADERMEVCMRASFPTIQLTIPGKTGFSVLTHIAAHYPHENETAFWDSHYLVIPFGYPLKALIIGEHFFVIAALTLGACAILILCVFTFSGADGRKRKHRFVQSWFMLPLTVSLLFCAILASQAIARHISLLQNTAALVQFGSKVTIAVLLISFLFALQEFLHAPVGLFINSESPLFISACNIFIFAAIDIQFFLPLVIEYAIIYRARKSTEATKLIASLLIMLLPFTPYIYTIMANGKEEAVTKLIFCTPGINFLFALLFFPFQIMWLRILFAFNLYRRNGKINLRRFVTHNALSIAVIFGITTLIIVTLSLVSYKITPEQEKKATIIHRDRDTVHVALSRTAFADLTTEHVTITTDRDAVRYELTLEAEQGLVPLYDASYDFKLNADATRARFDIPDFPPREITIDYAFSSETTGILTLTALYATEKAGVYQKETRVLTVSGSDKR